MAGDAEALCLNVRHAYRLLNAYHKRILSTIEGIGQRMGMDFDHWYGRNRHTARNTNTLVFRSPLGLNPLQNVGFVFRPNDGPPRAGQWMLEVLHIGDSGEGDGDERTYDALKLDNPAGERTEIWLSAGVVLSGTGTSWSTLWGSVLYPHDDKKNSGVIGQVDAWRRRVEGCDVVVLCRKYSVAEFLSDEDVAAKCDAFSVAVELALKRGGAFDSHLRRRQ